MMNHRALREDVCLLALNELDERARARVLEHVRTCSECRALHEGLTRIAGTLAGAPPAFDEEHLLAEARVDLMRTVRSGAVRLRWSDRLTEFLTGFSLRTYRVAVGAVAFLAAGILIGRTWPAAPAMSVPVRVHGAAPSQETRIANIRFQRSTDGVDLYDVEYDEVTPVRISGRLQDAAIQKALVRAMVGDENPGVRLRAVATLGTPGSKETDREIKAALVLALRSDPNAGVRKQALQVLRRLPYDDEIKNAFIHTLMFDRNPGLRVDAINSLDSVAAGNVATDRALLDALRESAARDVNTYVQWKARAVLQEAKKQ
jgi:hypothetical protein